MTHSEDKGFLGHGWDFLQYIIASSQYVLIGEMHGTKEIPLIIKEINRHKNFDYFITEIDSMSATYLVAPSVDKYQTLHNIPGAFAMYSTKDELELIKSISRRQLSVVGIDMVHPISFRFFLYQLLNEVDLSEKSRNILKKNNHPSK